MDASAPVPTRLTSIAGRPPMRVRGLRPRTFPAKAASPMNKRKQSFRLLRADALNRGERRGPRTEWRYVSAGAVQGAEAECVLGLHHLVDLRRALVDDRRARVAEVTPDPVLRGVAVGTVHLDGEMRSAERRL